MSSHLEFEQWVPFPIEHVFAFFSNPENLPRIMPATSDAKLVALNRTPPPAPATGVHRADESAGVGSTIVASFRVFPLLATRAQWVARITEFEWNHHFSDVQDAGPFKSWLHRHEFAAYQCDTVPGTLVRDVIDYEVGFSFAGKIANALFVRREIEDTFIQRQKTLPKLLGSCHRCNGVRD